jgi:hypothetical protein
MPTLILEFASDKPHLMEIENGILTEVKKHVKLNSNSRIPQPEQVGLFSGERRVAMFTYKWQLPLQEHFEEKTIRALQTRLSAFEVHRIYVEESA